MAKTRGRPRKTQVTEPKPTPAPEPTELVVAVKREAGGWTTTWYSVPLSKLEGCSLRKSEPDAFGMVLAKLTQELERLAW